MPKAFKEKFEAETGIKVNVRLVDDQGKQFNLLAAEAPNPTLDIMTVAGHGFLQFIDNDLLAPLDTTRLANWGNINPTFSESDWSTINGNKWGAPILSGMEVLSYNTGLVSAEEAQSWDVLFSEKFKGQTACFFLDAILASPEIGASMTKASGFISTYKDASQYLTPLEKQSTSFSDEELSHLQFFRAEANEMKYGLLDPAVEAIKAA